jgi:hypothetical protein
MMILAYFLMKNMRPNPFNKLSFQCGGASVMERRGSVGAFVEKEEVGVVVRVLALEGKQ